MDAAVAMVRGLRGFKAHNSGFPIGKFHQQTHPCEGAYLHRLAKTSEMRYRVAQISISHDGDTAIASCIADSREEMRTIEHNIIDDGTSSPLHEPLVGDEGWFEDATIK